MSRTLPMPSFSLPGFGRARLARWRHKLWLILWWTVTRQLHIQFGFWLRARRLRRAVPPASAPALIGVVSPGDIDVPRADSPVVSIIIPTHGHVDYSLRCLASIAAWRPEAPIEVIVVDDAGPAEDAALLAEVQGIRLLRNSVNLGFIGACNVAARGARGQYLLFLNNDTQVLPGWLDTMLIPIRTRDDVGAVGSMLLYPDGRLQEAGSVIWADGTGWNFGRLEDPASPAFQYLRAVDYSSGASLLVNRLVFLGMGGFDTCYTPAYYEDTDLCFRLRAQGLKTIYQPRSYVVHFEGVSHGRDVTSGIKAQQLVNHKVFTERWRAVLEQSHYPVGTHVMRARDRAHGRQIVLVVDHRTPEPDRDAGSRAVLCCLRAFLGAGLVVKFWPHDLIYNAGYTEALQDMGVEVFHGPCHPSFADWFASHGAEVDHIVLCRPLVAEACLPVVRRHSRARVIYFGHDLHFRRLAYQGEIHADKRLLRDADDMERRERALWRASNVSLYLSDEEASIASMLEPAARVRSIVPYGFSRFAAPRVPPARPAVIFVAGFVHPPNEDAALWFVAEVWPLIRAEVPEASLTLIGSSPGPRVRALAGDGITLTGAVSSDTLSQRYARAAVAVVPLRYGAGVKLKTVEALVEGTPLVTTPTGAQGLPGLDRVAAIETEAVGFAAAVCALLRDDALWQARSAAGISYARAHFHESLHAASLLGEGGFPGPDRMAAAA